MATSLKISKPFAYTEHVVLLNFRKAYEKRTIESELSIVMFLRLETERREGIREGYIEVLEN